MNDISSMRIFVTGGSGFIGTRLITDLLARGAKVCNLDPGSPTKNEHASCWVRGSVLDEVTLANALKSFNPTHLVHMAAETSMKEEGNDLIADYPVNCCSIPILSNALKDYRICKAVFVSTQYVCGPQGGLPEHPTHTFPHTRYGESKVVMENQVRSLYSHPWDIIRPTYIWGPHNKKNVLDVFNAVASGKYLHPGGDSVIRSYGYVGSVSWCVMELLRRDQLSGNTIYGTDMPEDSRIFMNRLSKALCGRGVLIAPRLFLRGLAMIGDRLRTLPINSFRYMNMTTSYPVSWKWTNDLIGMPPVDMDRAVDETVSWYQQIHRK